MRTIRMPLAALAVMAAASAAAAALLQVALVEDVSASSAGGVMLMDYVETGKVIALGPDDTLVLSYMSSCIQETIRGGTVTVGTTQGEVRSGKVERVKVACDAGRMLPAARMWARWRAACRAESSAGPTRRPCSTAPLPWWSCARPAPC